ncbi:MAG: hypothetical protein ACYDEC_11355 [Bacteroidia bacterium]
MATLKGENGQVIHVINTSFKEVEARSKTRILNLNEMYQRSTLSLKWMGINPASG